MQGRLLASSLLVSDTVALPLFSVGSPGVDALLVTPLTGVSHFSFSLMSILLNIPGIVLLLDGLVLHLSLVSVHALFLVPWFGLGSAPLLPSLPSLLISLPLWLSPL